MDVFEILVIVLSVTLAIFLGLAIALMIILLRISKRVDIITEKAANFAENLEEASELYRNASAPVAAAKVISNIIEWARNPKKDK